MKLSDLRSAIEAWDEKGAPSRDEVLRVVGALVVALETGEVRAARPVGDGGWTVEAWVKTGLLWGFRHAAVVDLPPAGPLAFRDKELFPPRGPSEIGDVRLVPGGSAIRRGAFVGAGVVLMPPCYVNVGAYVGSGTMIDSHALVGSCAQVGRGVHLSAGAQVGGVLEPPGAMPVVIEEGCFVGALAAVLEGVRVSREAVIGAGVVLTASTPVFDVPRRRKLERGEDGILVIPERAVVVPGSRRMSDPWAVGEGLATDAAVIVKDRDERTDAKAALESALR
ncbi:MAG: 2,3,4,5-tetrahydropyridine-2,6-dicarboxylate N-succinyltransferase [Acidobacteriota bacterium]|nr:2,3,4,5-tetrahydropyridine-2,6-dicarboxylate N-succinyltransferase [Acidobacteriota bacterium]